MPKIKINQTPKGKELNSDPAAFQTIKESSQVSQSILKPIDNSNMTTSNPAPTSTSSQTPTKPKAKKIIPILAALVVLVGIGSGYILASFNNKNGGPSIVSKDRNLKREVSTDEIQIGTKVGVADESTFRDDAVGEIEKGGIEGEGSHKLLRPGGETQTVALTSSIIDLDQFVGRKVHVWGETMDSQKAPWFMDIGKLEVLE